MKDKNWILIIRKEEIPAKLTNEYKQRLIYLKESWKGLFGYEHIIIEE